MKIAIDCRLYAQTGVGRYIRGILTELIRPENAVASNHEFLLVVRKEDAHYFVNFPKTIKIVETDAKWHSLKEQFVIPYLLWKNKVNLVHFPYFNVPVFLPQKFIVTIHDLTINKFKTGASSSLPKLIYFIKKIAYLFVVYVSIKRARIVLTVSETVEEEIVKKYGLEKSDIKVIYNGSDLEMNSQQSADGSRQNNIGGYSANRKLPTANYILYVGNLHPHKNVETLILAFDSFIKEEKYKDYLLIIVSPLDYFYKKIFDFALKLNLEKEIIFTGPVSNSNLSFLYKKAAVFVFPSFSEGFGIPGVEAMRYGCPVVASDLPIFHEIYGRAFLSFNAKNVDDLKEKMILAVSNTAIRSKLYEKGVEQAKLYSWEKMGSEVLGVYNRDIS